MSTFGLLQRGTFAKKRSYKVSATEKKLFRFRLPVRLKQAGVKRKKEILSVAEEKSKAEAINTIYRNIFYQLHTVEPLICNHQAKDNLQYLEESNCVSCIYSKLPDTLINSKDNFFSIGSWGLWQIPAFTPEKLFWGPRYKTTHFDWVAHLKTLPMHITQFVPTRREIFCGKMTAVYKNPTFLLSSLSSEQIFKHITSKVYCYCTTLFIL